jgi:hypothetical protein
MTADITPENVARMLEGVTDGPWQADSAFCRDGQARRVSLPDRLGVPAATIAECAENWHEAEEYGETRISWKEAEANARFIAWAREAVPALAARVASQSIAIEGWREDLTNAHNDKKELRALIRRAHEAIVGDEQDGGVWSQLLADMAKEIGL